MTQYIMSTAPAVNESFGNVFRTVRLGFQLRGPREPPQIGVQIRKAGSKTRLSVVPIVKL